MRKLHSRLLVGGVMAGISSFLGTTIGCFPQQTNRAQIAEDPEKDLYSTIGSKTEIGNAEPVPVSGVGLVYGLRGTGSSAQADGWRSLLETTLKKRQLDTKLLLDNPDRKTSLVLVSTAIPPGARKGDRLDVMISLPQASKTTSLQHGILDLCQLSNYEAAGMARQQLTDAGIPTSKVPLASSNSLMLGNKLAIAEGPLVSGAIVNEAPKVPEEASQAGPVAVESYQSKIAKIWGGATCQIDRPYYFLIQRTTPQPRLAMVIASRLNTVFHGGDRANKIAEAKVEGGKPFVTVVVPAAYRHNHERFLMVARNVLMQAPIPGDGHKQKLEQELTQPHTSIEAAIKLEAMGSESEDALRVGLESSSPWVRFASAQSLAYLGKADPRTAAVLGELAEKHAALRTHCLLALASQDDAPCVEQLLELMKKSDARLRYGAFTALRTANENHDAIRGRRLGTSYWMHTIAPESDSLVHLTTDRRNEIVLFGSVWPLKGPFSFPIGTEFTVTMKADAKQVVITRLATTKRDEDNNLETVTGLHRPDLSEVLKGMAALGASYSESIEFIRRAANADSLLVPLAIDSVPRSFSIPDLVRISRVDPQLEKANATALKLVDGKAESGSSANLDLPTEGEAVRAEEKPSTTEPQLSRTQGSVLRAFEGEKAGPALNRNPGTLFGGK